MTVTFKRPWEAVDASNAPTRSVAKKVIIPAGTYEVERVPNPFGLVGYWLVLKGTLIGASEESWRQWHNGEPVSNPTHPNYGKPIDWGEFEVVITE